MPLTGLRVGCLGGGAMAEAMLTGLINSGVPADRLIASDVSSGRRDYLEQKYGIETTGDNKLLAQAADIIILAIKPQVIPAVMKDMSSVLETRHTLISIAAGIETKVIEGYLPRPVPVVRVMPNTPCLVGAGASAVCSGAHAEDRDRDRAVNIFSAMGRVVEVPENLMDAVTGLSGSGPAYIFVVIDALADAGVRMGLPRETALVLGAQTVLGAAKMYLETGEHPGHLKDKVTTPGGTTIAGLYELEKGGLRVALMSAVEAATKRSREISGN